MFPPCFSGLLGLALDRRLLAAADLDAARLGRLGLLDRDLQDAVAVVRLDVVLGHALGKCDRAREAAEAPLEAVGAIVLHLVDPLALAADGESAVVELDRDLVLRDP